MSVNVEMPKLDWSTLDQVRAYNEWKDFLESYLFINKVVKEEQWHYIKLSAGSKGKDLWDSWQLTDAQKKDPNVIFGKFASHLVGTVNKWVMRLELAEINQGEAEPVEDYVCRLKAKADKCSFPASTKSEQITFQLIKGIKWSETRRKLISKGNDLTLDDAIEIAQNFQATLSSASSFEKQMSVNSVRQGRSQSSHRKSCRYCGTSHPPKKCPAYGKKCHKCGRTNHFGNVCQDPRGRSKSSRRSKSKARNSDRYKNSSKTQVHANEVSDKQEQIYFDDTPLNCGSIQFSETNVATVTNSKGERQAIIAKLDINPPNVLRKVTLKVKADTGSNGNIIPTRCLRQMYPSANNDFADILKPTFATLTAVNNTNIHTLGTIELPTSLDKCSVMNLLFYACDTNGPAILSCDASEKLGIITVKESKSISSIHEKNETSSLVSIPDVSTMKRLFPKCFEGIGEMKGEYHIELKPDSCPVIVPPRKYPIQLKEEIIKKIEELEEMKVVKKCPDDEPSDWIHALAFTRKASGELRVCLDPKPLNNAIKRTYHKIPTLDEISYKLSGSTIYSKLDAKNGYWSIRLDEESSKLCTFQSPAGKHRFLRLPFGLSVSQDIFQCRMDKILGKVGEGVIGIADDVVVYGKTLEEHDHNLYKLLKVAAEEGLVFRDEKCCVRQQEIDFFGLVWSKEGMQPDPKKCDEINNRPPPTNVQELQSFLGLVQYLSPFVPLMAERTKVLRQLLKKEVPFEWSIDHQNAFEELKQAIHTDTKLRYFDTARPVTLEVDASQHGLGAALIQDRKPVAFASKSLTPAETRYANIEREMLSVVFALEHFHCFVYGKAVTVISDHKPLENIHLKQLSQAPPRLQRMLLRIQPYDVTIKYKPGKELIFADYLSRIQPSPGKEVQLEHAIHVIQISQKQLEKVKEATDVDCELSMLREQVISGWPESAKILPKSVRQYYAMKDFLSVEDGVIFFGERLVVPSSMKIEYLRRIHEGHMGISKSQARAKECLHWNGMMKDIAEHIGDCRECLLNARTYSNEPMLSHSTPSYPWQSISSDLFELDGQNYVLVADNFSKMPFVKRLGRDTTSRSVIAFLEELFSVHGSCQVLYSDNGPQYSSAEFKHFVEEWDIVHVTSSPRYAQSNGFIERMVGVVKSILTKAKMSGSNLHKALLAYRACPLSNGMKSPAELLFRRKISNSLPVKLEATTDLIDHHSKLQEVSEKSKVRYDSHARSELSELLPGMKVLVQDGKKWFPATIKSKNPEPRSYTIITPNGNEIRRNRKFLKELTKNASQQFTFRSLPVDDPVVQSTVPEERRTSPKSVSFDERRNLINIIPATESSVPASPMKHSSATDQRGRPKRNIVKPIRYREDV